MFLFRLNTIDFELQTFLKDRWYLKYIKEPSTNHDDLSQLDQNDLCEILKFSMIQKLNQNGIFLDTWSRFFICKKHTKSPIHIDGIPPRNCAINFPIEHTETSPMIWYRTKSLSAFCDQRLRMFYANESECQEVFRDVLDQPSIFNTSKLHCIDNTDNKNNRVIFSLRFLNNPTFDNIKEILGGPTG